MPIQQLTGADESINVLGNNETIQDFGGSDTYQISPSLSGDVVIADQQASTIILPVGMTISEARFAANGVQFDINGNTLELQGDVANFTFVFGGDPLDPSVGTPLSFDDLAAAFGTTVPTTGVSTGTNSGEINDDGTVGDAGLTPEEIYDNAIAAYNDAADVAEQALADAAAAQAAADEAEANVTDLESAEAYKAAADAAKAAADAAAAAAADAQAAAADAAAAAANTTGTDDDAEAAAAVAEADGFAADAAAAQATADAEVDSAEQAVADNTPNPGQNFILTTGQDVIPGMNGSEGTPDNSGDDTIFGLINSNQFLVPPTNTFTLGDNLDGGAGSDLLNLTVGEQSGTITLFTTVLSNIEHVKFDITHDGLDEIDVNDQNNEIESVILDFLGDDRDDELEVFNVNPNAHLAVQNVADGEDEDITFFLNETMDPISGSILIQNVDNLPVYIEPDDDADGSSSSDVFSVEFNNVMNSDGDTEFYITDIETLNVLVSGDSELENFGSYYNNDGSDGPNPNIVNLTLDADLEVGFWDFSDDEVPSFFNIDGSGNLFIDDLDDGDSDMTLDASSATGNININDASSSLTGLEATFGSGDDRLIMEDGFDFDTVMADGGDGVDIFGGSLDDIEAASMDPDFGDMISNFEKIEVDEVVLAGEDYDIDMSGLNDIDYLISAGTDAAIVTQPALPEIQRYEPIAADADGGIISVFGVNITIASLATDVDVAAAIAAEEADILTANPDLQSVVHVPGQDSVTFTWLDTVGDVGLIGGSIQDESASGVTFGPGSADTPGVAGAGEQQEIDFGNPADTGTFTISTALGNVTVDVLTGDTPDQVATKAAAALTASGLFASAVAAADVVTITYNNGTGPVAEPTFPDALSIFAPTQVPVASETAPAGPNTDEIQTYQITGAPTSDGEIVVGGVRIEVTLGMSEDDVGAAIKNAEADILAANPTLQSVDYNTLGSELTFIFDGSAGDVPPIQLADNAVLPVGGPVVPVQNGQVFIGTPEGVLNVDIASGGTLEFTGDNDGLTNVFVDGALTSGSDVFNVMLNGDDALTNDGQLSIENVETVNIMTDTSDGDPSGQALLNLIANEASSLTVSGNHGVDLFGSQLNSLTMFDGSGVVSDDPANGSIFIDDFAADADVTAIGGDGDDIIDASIVGTGTMDDVGATLDGGDGDDLIIGSDGADVIDGGAGDDEISSSGGSDVFTLGAGEDSYVMLDATDSTIAMFDIISDFVLGEDLLDFSQLLVVAGNGIEVNVFNNAADATTDLANNDMDAAFNVALDSSTGNVYLDFDDDGIANSVIQLTGVTTLDDTAIFV